MKDPLKEVTDRQPVESVQRMHGDARGCGCPLRVAIPIAARLVLGGLFLYAGWLKLGISSFDGILPTIDPSRFAFSIKGFDIPGVGSNEAIIGFMAYSIPWVEMLAGLLLIVGLWTRAAALTLTLVLAGFTAGIISVLTRGMIVNCPCFGQTKFLCPETIGNCHLLRNSGLMLAALAIVAMGPGALCIDPRSCCKRS